MKRRDAIKLGAVAAGVGMGVPGCSLPKLVGTMQGPTGAADFNTMLDEQLAKLDGPGLLQRLVTARTKQALTPEQTERIAAKDELFRRVLGTVLITQAFRELPEETRNEQAVQARMWSHYDQIGSTIFEIGDMLAELSPQDRAKLRTTLEDNPDLSMELGEALDARAARAGISKTRRLQLRRMMSQTAFRLKHNHAGSMIDEYVAKVEKLRATDERHAEALALAAQLNEKAFWRHQQMLAQDPPGTPTTRTPTAPPGPSAPTAPPGPSAPTAPPPLTEVEILTQSARVAARKGDCRAIEMLGARVLELDPTYYHTIFQPDPEILSCTPGVDRDAPPPRPPRTRSVFPRKRGEVAYVPSRSPVAPAKKQDHPGEGGLRIGGYMFGIGFGIGLVSAAMLSTEALVGPGLVGLTVGVLMVGIGLIVLLFSALIYAANA